ncbi:EAL domain-containing protein [Chroococcidiopsis thermalis]|uniref:Diguanylate cyclase/phosphodiesterase with PAS/PAC sensor(S) n=1 Tax=Chroococcidiopsis thermalis (strain PCC 7203) TaxID=251229 RepID=K9U540_CHRTP|nr:EAL domain-containing protein [Chroococcidiopsis thermalis]AFY89743.1 diguanylate cyclase/phosphodiesterase with PAS/PAC sensor(s) [Chroococcidiopsis thermalis PCC 7203]
MTLRKKTLIITGMTLFSLFVALYSTSKTILLDGFTQVEEQDADQNVRRIVQAYNDELNKLNIMNGDEAEWDGTYTDIETGNLEYFQNAFNYASLVRSNLDLIMYIRRRDRRIVYNGFITPYTKQALPVPKSLQKYFQQPEFFSSSNNDDPQRMGLLQLPEGLMLIAVRQILTSEGKGPSRGILVMGRYLDVKQLAAKTHFDIALERLDHPPIPLDFQRAEQTLIKNEQVFVRSLDESTIAGYAMLRNMEGNPAAILRVNLPRQIYQRGQLSVRYLVWLLLLVGLVFSVTTLLLLEKLVLSRIARLSSDVSRIGASSDLRSRVEIPGNDELACLASTINWMLTQLNQSQAALLKSEERYRVFLAQSSEGIWRCELERPVAIQAALEIQVNDFYQHGYLAECNEVLARMFGYASVGEMLGARIGEFLPKSIPANIEFFRAFISSGYRLVDAELCEFDRHGNLHYFLNNLIGIVENGYLVRVWGVQHDITARKQAEEALVRAKIAEAANLELTREINERKRIELALSREKELAQVTLHSIGDAVITTDAEGYVQSLNPVAEKLTRWDGEQARGLPLDCVFKIVNEITRETLDNPVERVLDESRIVKSSYNTLLIGRDGTEFAIDHSAAPIYASDRQLIGSILVFRDITQANTMARQLAWQASHDPLTELYNRREFEKRLATAVHSAQNGSIQHVLCYLDLDQFKIINDTCGHAAGDMLLRHISSLLPTQLRKTDTLARLGGDEFGILLYSCPLEQATQIANVLRQQINDYRFVWQDKTFTVGVSIGLVEINITTPSVASVLSAADAACYVAKNKGRNRVHIYQLDDTELAIQQGEMQWVTRLPQALEDNRFRLFYQPIAAIAPTSVGSPHHCEVLLRLEDETGKLVSPMAFIPAAERYHLMHRIDRWVIQTLFRHLMLSSTARLPHVYAVNLSGATLNDEQFISFVQEQFALTEICPQLICFEVTETVAITNLAKAAAVMRQLKALGCSFALDDFGSGMSSFAYLKNLPVDYLKIDGVFVREIVSDPIAAEMVAAIAKIASVMGIQTIAEFVEDEFILDKLRQLGVDYAQGYGISQPKALTLNRPVTRLHSQLGYCS